MVEKDEEGKETLFGNEIIQLKPNTISRGLVALERMFSNVVCYKTRSKHVKEEDIEGINLGIESTPNMVYISKKLAPIKIKC